MDLVGLLVERAITEAMERGEFDNLPGAGKPLELDPSEDWWIRAKIRRENLDPVLPGPLALRKEVEGIQDALAGVRSEDEAREVCEDLNDRVKDFYRRGWQGPRVVVRLVDVEAELARWRATRGT